MREATKHKRKKERFEEKGSINMVKNGSLIRLTEDKAIGLGADMEGIGEGGIR